MTSKAAMCQALLRGATLNIKNGFTLFGITNIPREISRGVEQSFDVTVTRTQREGKSRFGQPCVWVDYTLEPTAENGPGIKKMIEYIRDQRKLDKDPKTKKEKKELEQTKQSLEYMDNMTNALTQSKLL